MGGGDGQDGGEVLACEDRRVKPGEMPNMQVRFLLVLSQLEYLKYLNVQILFHKPFQNYGGT